MSYKINIEIRNDFLGESTVYSCEIRVVQATSITCADRAQGLDALSSTMACKAKDINGNNKAKKSDFIDVTFPLTLVILRFCLTGLVRRFASHVFRLIADTSEDLCLI